MRQSGQRASSDPLDDVVLNETRIINLNTLQTFLDSEQIGTEAAAERTRDGNNVTAAALTIAVSRGASAVGQYR